MAGITKLGKYLIRRELGKGAMGVVYEGFDPVIERVVAIKTILPHVLGLAEAQAALARFKREAQAAGRLNHPHIVSIYDYGEVVAEDDQTLVATVENAQGEGQRVAFIAMEFVKGRELRDYFEANERFALTEVQRIMGELLSALAHAHSQGVVHRDIKPANLIMLDDGTIKVADFGIARIEKSDLTQTGTILGTPSYMSPEQFMGQWVDGRSDIFSCGVILYQFLTGEKPFTGNTTTIMYKVLQEDPIAPSLLNGTLPVAFDAVVKKAIAKNPDERFQTAQEFSKAIDEALVSQSRPESTTSSSPTSTSAPDTTLVAAAAVTPAPTHASRARWPRNLALAGAALVVALGGGAYWLSGNKPPAPEAVATSALPVSPVTPAPAQDPPLEPGTMVISALGLVDPGDPKFQGDAAAAGAEARADAKRQLIEKALSLYVDKQSLDKNYAVLEQKLFSQSGTFIRSVLNEGAPTSSPAGLVEAQTRAIVNVRAVQKSLNQLSKDERIDFIRNNGDPKVAVKISILGSESSQALPPARSALAENVLKERIRSFGFRVWNTAADASSAPETQTADFQIVGEVKVKLLPIRLAASGLTISKTALTSWTLTAIDQASGEEIYLNTVIPTGKSWNTEDLALVEIGKLVGDEFSKNFFLQHFNFASQRLQFNVRGLPDEVSGQSLLRELRGFRQVLDAQPGPGLGQYQLQLAQGSASQILQDVVLKSLNAKLGQSCFALDDAGTSQVNAHFAPACVDAATRNRMDTQAPAGLSEAPEIRGQALRTPRRAPST